MAPTALCVGCEGSYALMITFRAACYRASRVSRGDVSMFAVRNPKDRIAVKLVTPEPSRAKQSHKDECDINNIMARYQRTGLIEAVNRLQPQYADVSGIEFRTSMEMVAQAQQLFEQMPSGVRKRFGNDPGAFLDFVNDPENRPEAERLGLVKKSPVEASVEPQGPAEPVPSPEPAKPA